MYGTRFYSKAVSIFSKYRNFSFSSNYLFKGYQLQDLWRCNNVNIRSLKTQYLCLINNFLTCLASVAPANDEIHKGKCPIEIFRCVWFTRPSSLTLKLGPSIKQRLIIYYFHSWASGICLIPNLLPVRFISIFWVLESHLRFWFLGRSLMSFTLHSLLQFLKSEGSMRNIFGVEENSWLG